MSKETKTHRSKRAYEIGAAAALLALLVVWAMALQWTQPDRELTAAQKRLFAVARVTDVLADNAAPDAWTEGRRIGEQYLEVQICSGPYKGTVLETYNYLNAYMNVDAKLGSRIIVRLDIDDQGDPYIAAVPSYDRAPMLLGLILVFAVLLVCIGRKKGAMALAGLIYTLACLWYLEVPMILRGASPVLTTIVIVALTTAASLFLLTGFSKKTLCALLGCVGGTSVAALFAALAGTISPLNGFNMAEAEELVLRTTQTDLQISGLFVSGILVASLGAVMDVAMSIASSCHELYVLNPKLSRKNLFRSGMNIGRDAM
ncbi:MAG: YibE/F family protein, partial [Faecousia sp.]